MIVQLNTITITAVLPIFPVKRDQDQWLWWVKDDSWCKQERCVENW